MLPDSLKAPQPLPGEPRLRCEVEPIKPHLDFSLRLQAGYLARVPMSQYFGPGHKWTIRTRITAEDGDRRPVYLLSTVRLPNLPKTNITLQVGGGFWVGEGRYSIDWMLVDDSARTCRKTWRLDARLAAGDRKVKTAIPPHTVQDFSLRRITGATSHAGDFRPFRLTVLLHAAPIIPGRTRMRASDQALLLSSLASVLEQLPARSVRLVLFNLDQQRELFHQDVLTRASLSEAVQAMNVLELGVVDYHVLQNRGGHVDLLADLLNRELGAQPSSDVVIFLGPTARYSDKVPPAALARPAGVTIPFFYFQFKPYRAPEFPDSVDFAIRKLNGRTVIIRSPDDLAKAIAQVKRQIAAGP